VSQLPAGICWMWGINKLFIDCHKVAKCELNTQNTAYVLKAHTHTHKTFNSHFSLSRITYVSQLLL